MPLPTSTFTPDSAPAPRRRLLPGVVLGVLLVQGLAFVISAAMLAHDLRAKSQPFEDVGRLPSLLQLLWANLDLAWGYGFVGLGMILLAWPLVGWTLAKKARLSLGMIVRRAAGIALGVWGFFALKFFFARPFYFLDSADSQDLAHRITTAVPAWLQTGLFEVFPWLVVVGLAAHYTGRFLQWRMPLWPHHAIRLVSMLGVALVGLIAWGGSRLPAATAKIPPRPNILILAADSLRADHLSSHGYVRATTPTIDALAARSTQFTQCHTPIASTLEGMTSLMTSQYPHTHGLQHSYPNREQIEHVKLNSPTLAGQLESAGYETTVMGDWCAGIFTELPQGFSKLDVATRHNYKVHLAQLTYRDHPLLPIFFENHLGYTLFPSLRSRADTVTPEVVTERLKEQLSEQASHEQPFFITAFFSTTHLPYVARSPWRQKFAAANPANPHRGRIGFDVDAFLRQSDPAAPRGGLSETDASQIVDLYDDCVANFDDTVREVLEHLEKTGQAEHTIVLVTADHGDALFEPQCSLGHGRSFNGGDQDTHIPCVLHVPGQVKMGTQVNRLVRSIDFAPTLLELAGVPVDARMEGVSLRPYLTQEAANLSLAVYAETGALFAKRAIPGEEPLYIEPPAVIAAVDYTFDGHFVLLDAYQEEVLKTKERCLRTEYWKLVFSPGMEHDIWRLFDLRKDPRCEHPVNFTYPAIFKAMQSRLLSWMREKKESRIGDIFPDGEPTADMVSTQ